MSRIIHIPMDKWALLLITAVYIGFFPFFPALHSANELTRLYLTWAMVYDHDLSISKELHEFGDIGDKSVRQGRFYSDKPPGIAVMSIPPIYVRKLMGGKPNLAIDLRLARLFSTVLPGLLLLLLIRALMLERGVSRDVTAMVLLGLGLGSLLFTYSILLYSHITTAFFLFAGYFLVIKRDAFRGKGLLIGLSCGAAVTSEYQAALYCLPIGIYFIIKHIRKPYALMEALLGAAIPIGLLAYYQHSCFGSVWKTSYSFVANKYFASIHHKGFMGVSFPHIKNIWGSLFSLSKGMFFYSPISFLGFMALFTMHKGLKRRDWWLSVILPALPFLFVASMVYYLGGWTVSQRHLTPMVAFFALPIGLFVEKHRWSKTLLPPIVLASIVITGLSTLTFPHLPESFANPLHQIVIPLADRGCFARFFGMSGVAWALILFVGTLLMTMGFSVRNLNLKSIALSWFFSWLLIAGLLLGSAACCRQSPKKEHQRLEFFLKQYRAAGCSKKVL